MKTRVKNKFMNATAFQGVRMWTGTKSCMDLLKAAKKDGDKMLLQRAHIAQITKADDGDEKSRIRKFTITTESPDRHGDVVRAAGGNLENYKANPVVLFAHASHMPPIGKSPTIGLDKKSLGAEVEFFTRDTYDFADTIFRLVDAGGLKATSIGFIPLEWDRLDADGEEVSRGFEFTKWDLLEFSIVPVPANPECVMRAFHDGAAMKPLVRYLEEQQDNWDKMHEVFESLGFGQDHVNLVRRAAMGRRSLVQNKKIDKNEKIEPITFRTVKMGSVELTELVGEFPKKTKIVKEMLDLPHIVAIGDTITLNLANATALYNVQEEADDHVVCGLVESRDKDFELQSVSGRKSKWASREEFIKWAEKEGYSTDEVVSTKNFWRLEQRSLDDFAELRLASLDPENDDVDPSSQECKVQAKGGVLKAKVKAEEEDGSNPDEEGGDEDGDQSVVVKLDLCVDELIASEKDLTEDDMKTLEGAVQKLVKFLNDDEEEDEEEDSADEEDAEGEGEGDKELDFSTLTAEDLKDALGDELPKAIAEALSESGESEDESEDDSEDEDEEEDQE